MKKKKIEKINHVKDLQKNYKEGFFTKLKTEELKKGINEETIYSISKKKNEPEWMLKFRLNAYNKWKEMKEPHWLNAKYKKINYNNYSYYSAPLSKENILIDSNKYEKKKKDYLTKEVKMTFKKLGIPIKEENNIAVDAIFDSVSVSTTYRKKLSKKGIIFCSFGEAIQEYQDLVYQYLGSVVPFNDNFFAALNSAVASDGTFVYIPKNVRCPMELSTYFRMNSSITNQFERTILIADENSYVSYIEGCSAPLHYNHQLHAAVVEVIVLKNAEVRYSTVQNWSSGSRKKNQGGILNFVTKRALCKGNNSKMSWTQSETGSAITWKYPSVILKGNNSIGEFFSVSFTKGKQQADTGTKMIHIGKNTKSTIISKGISTECSKNTYRSLVKIINKAENSRNFTQCDSMLIGNKSSSYTFPSIEVKNNTAQLEHEASASKINENQLFYCRHRGLLEREAITLLVQGFCKEIFSKLPLEFAIEAKKLLSINLENSIG